MRKEYIPVTTSETIYYKPQTKQEFDSLIENMKVGDMIFSKWVFQASGGIWYTMGLMDENNPNTKMLFPNILLGSELSKPLSHWGLARMNYLKEHNKFLVTQMGTIVHNLRTQKINEKTGR